MSVGFARLRVVGGFVRSVAVHTTRHRLTRHSAALAFYTLVSLAPVSMALLGLAGTFFEESTARARIVGEAESTFGPEVGEVVDGVLESLVESERDVLSGVVGIVALVLGMTAVFTQLQDALNTVFGIEPGKTRRLPRIVRKRLLSFLMVLALGGLLLVTLTVGAALSFLRGILGTLATSEISIALAISANELASFVLLTFFFALVYWVLPDADLQLRDAVSGAVVTGLLFAGGRFVIGTYLAHSDRASPFGTASSLVLFLLWIYFSSLIFLIGAELTREWATRAGRLETVPVGSEAPPRDPPGD